MTTVLLVVHLMIAVALVAVVLMQRSEGGALGMGGGGGGGGGFMTGRGTANMLTRTTAVLAAAFFATSIALALIAQKNSAPSGSIFENLGGQSGAPSSGGSGSTPSGGVLDDLKRLNPSAPAPVAPPAPPAAPSAPQSQ